MIRILLFSLLLFVITGGAPASAGPSQDAVREALEQLADNPTMADDASRLERFYAARDFRPLWNDAKRRKQLLDELDALRDDGLDPAWYDLPRLTRLIDEAHARDLPACLELEASRAFLQAVLDLTFGRVTPERPEAVWRFGEHTLAPGMDFVLVRSAIDADDIASVFNNARPQSFGYRSLREAHRALRTETETHPPPPPVPAGSLLRPGTRDTRVAAVRARLTHAGYAADLTTDARHYDAALETVVKAFQDAHRLASDGVVGPATLAVLNRSRADQLDQLRVNLERIRWVAHELGPRFLLVNIPGAEIRYLAEGETRWSARTQVGRASRPTPTLKSEVTHFTINPTWTVPPTILRNDKLPEIRRDIGYLERNNMRVLDHSGNRLNPYEVDWNNPSGIMLRQDAGPQNALGQVAIRFPNPFSVYLHDTPSQSIFGRDQRSVSSGCVRVESATDLVALLMEDRDGTERERLERALSSGRTQNLRLSNPVPVLLAYWTAWADDRGEVHYANDLYQRDDALLGLLDASGRPDRRALCPDA